MVKRKRKRKKVYTPIDEQLKRALEDCNVSQTQIAIETGIDQSVISRFVGGKRNMSLKAFVILAKHLRLSLFPERSILDQENNHLYKRFEDLKRKK